MPPMYYFRLLVFGFLLLLQPFTWNADANCIADILVYDNTTLAGGNYEANSTIIVRYTDIAASANVSLNAGGNVIIENNFSAPLGTTLNIESNISGGQTGCPPPALNITNLPSSSKTANNRFMTNQIAEIAQPSLSINGFNCVTTMDCGIGLGLKQILEDVYGANPTPSIEAVHNALIGFSDDAIVQAPVNRSQVEENTIVLQAQAYVALIAYIIHQQPNVEPEMYGLPSYGQSISDLTNSLLNGAAWIVNDNLENGGDAVKWTEAVANMARVFDLYLALENAFQYYGNNGDGLSANEYSGQTATMLLSSSNKTSVTNFYKFSIDQLYILGKDIVPDWLYFIPGFTVAAYLADQSLTGYTIQAGNWPLKVLAAVGLGALQIQGGNGAIIDASDAVEKAFESVFGNGQSNNRHYWNYQTYNGKRFFAEGPYYMQFALRDVIPFWHAIRLNDMLNWDAFSLPDPFTASQYTTPLDWLADITTPDYRTPPLDDGNKQTMPNASILRWESSYGDGAIGQKFAWIRDNDPSTAASFAQEPNLLLVELAIPRLEIGEGVPPDAEIVNGATDPLGDNAEQTLVLRRGASSSACNTVSDSEECHYLLLNAESSVAAYERGEGHEQPDQMQLLYYVDNASMLMDSGYDDAAGFGIGSWSYYYDHNVIASITPSGGLAHNFVDIFETRKDILEVPASVLHKKGTNQVDVLSAAQLLIDGPFEVDGSYTLSDYYRDVLFINDDNPYLIDFNQVRPNSPLVDGLDFLHIPDPLYTMQYHVDANQIALNNFTSTAGNFISWSNVRESNGKNLYIYPVTIEHPTRVANGDIVNVSDDAEERFRTNVPIQRLDISPGLFWSFFTVASIIQAGDTPPQYAPELLFVDSNDYYDGLRHRGWIWQRDTDVYDVFIGRTAKLEYEKLPIRAHFEYMRPELPGIPFYLPMVLPTNYEYGFARIIKVGTQYELDPNYSVNLAIGTPFQPAINGGYGDINLDNTITSSDADLILQHVVGAITLTNTPLLNADVSGDGTVSALDAAYVLQHDVGDILCFPVEDNCGYGDANADNTISSLDSDLILAHAAGSDTIPAEALYYADVTGDDTISPLDASLVLQLINGVIPCFDAVDPQCVIDGQTAASKVKPSVPALTWQTNYSGESSLVQLVLSGVSDIPVTTLSLDIDHFDMSIKDLQTLLPDGWTVYHSGNDQKSNIKMAGISPLREGELLHFNIDAPGGEMLTLSGKGYINGTLPVVIPDKNVQSELPKEFSFAQNYPNPFSQQTTFRYTLPEGADIYLSIYDMLGREVSILVDEYQGAGIREVGFIASHLASGAYVARITMNPKSGGSRSFSKTLVITK